MNKTLEAALKTNKPTKIVSVENYEHMGVKRQSIKAMKANGRKVYNVIRYETGLYSNAVAY